jgi:hypothetical protein
MFANANPQYPVPGVPPMDVIMAGQRNLGEGQGMAGMGAGWGDAFKGILTQFGAAGAKIIETRYAVPDLDPGTVIQRGAGGTTIAKGVPGTIVGVGSGAAAVSPGISMGTVLLVGGALAVFMLVKGRS